jgi:hypothetical protein
MTTYTAAAFLSSPAFLAVAAEDALQLIAKTNGQTYALTLEALGQCVPNVVRELERLLGVAAEHCAAEANAGRLWA